MQLFQIAGTRQNRGQKLPAHGVHFLPGDQAIAECAQLQSFLQKAIPYHPEQDRYLRTCDCPPVTFPDIYFVIEKRNSAKKIVITNEKFLVLFHMNCFRWADINAGFTVDTHVLIDFRLFILDCYCRSRALTHTSLTPGAFILVHYCYHPFHSTIIASEGQMSTQFWQSTHRSLSTFAFSFSSPMADAGHSSTQVSHPVHLLVSTIATNFVTPSYMLHKR
jgi:hypothetical protein